MKHIKTYIAVSCVLVAILASRVYTAVQKSETPENSVSIVSEIKDVEEPDYTPPPVISHKLDPSIAKPKDEDETAPVNSAVNSPAPKTVKEFLLPASGEISRPYSGPELVYFAPIQSWQSHLGIDFMPSENDLVVSTAEGTVERVYEDYLYGTCVIIDHGENLKSIYGSLSEVSVSVGDTVAAAQTIGKMGESAACEEGKHLHFAMEKDAKPIDPFSDKQ